MLSPEDKISRKSIRLELRWYILCFVDRASRYNRIKKKQSDAQLIVSIFRQYAKNKIYERYPLDATIYMLL